MAVEVKLGTLSAKAADVKPAHDPADSTLCIQMTVLIQFDLPSPPYKPPSSPPPHYDVSDLISLFVINDDCSVV